MALFIAIVAVAVAPYRYRYRVDYVQPRYTPARILRESTNSRN